MNARCRSFFTLLIVLLFTGCASQNNPDTLPVTAGSKMRGDELYELLANKTMILDEYGQKAHVEMYENGTLLAQKGSAEKNEGTWQIEEDQLCIKFRRWGYGDEVCHDVFKVGDEYRQYTASGVLTNRFTVTEGVLNDPTFSVGERADKRKTPKKMRQARPDTPDVLVETPVAEAPAPAKSAPAIQEQPADTRDPQAYKKDLRLIYRDMSQNCPGCNLPNIELAGASLPHANLAGANLKNSNFSKANLKWVNLKGAILKGANLREADLAGADLAGADLDGADLTGAILNKTNLQGAKIDTAIGINLSGAIR